MMSSSSWLSSCPRLSRSKLVLKASTLMVLVVFGSWAHSMFGVLMMPLQPWLPQHHRRTSATNPPPPSFSLGRGVKTSSRTTLKAYSTNSRKETNALSDPPQTTPRHLVWLLSFPNSGTSFTMHTIPRASQQATASNYGREGRFLDKFNVPVLMDNNNTTTTNETTTVGPPFVTGGSLRYRLPYPNLVLTKTHCTGGRDLVEQCDLGAVLNHSETTPMAQECARGHALGPDKVERVFLSYSTHVVKKAIHVIRHPLDNLVSRYHLTAKNLLRKQQQQPQNMQTNSTLADFNATTRRFTPASFQRFCQWLNANPKLVCWKEALANRVSLDHIPCWPELLKYVVWHNRIFAMTTTIATTTTEAWNEVLPEESNHNDETHGDSVDKTKLPTLLLRYEDYDRNLTHARQRLLDWLEQPLKDAKARPAFVYQRHYDTHFTPAQRRAAFALLKATSSAETWHHVAPYAATSLEL